VGRAADPIATMRGAFSRRISSVTTAPVPLAPCSDGGDDGKHVA